MTIPKLSLPRNDLEAERVGVWESWLGHELLIARADTPTNATAIRRLTEAKRVQVKRRELTREELEEIETEWLARYVLLDWRGAKDETGESIAYAPEIGISVLSDPEYRDLREFVIVTAHDGSRYRRRMREDALGN